MFLCNACSKNVPTDQHSKAGKEYNERRHCGDCGEYRMCSLYPTVTTETEIT